MKRPMLILVFLFLAACCVNLIAAILLYFPPTNNQIGGRAIVHTGPAAAAHGWPARTPHAAPWPSPSSWESVSVLGRRYVQASGSVPGGNGGFQMQASRAGWPFPVIQHTMRWWPWDDPQWKMAANIQDAGISLVWTGLVLNPLIAALGVWLAVFGPVAAWRHMQRRRRTARSLCPACGYPIGVSARCTECGVVLPVRPAVGG